MELSAGRSRSGRISRTSNRIVGCRGKSAYPEAQPGPCWNKNVSARRIIS